MVTSFEFRLPISSFSWQFRVLHDHLFYSFSSRKAVNTGGRPNPILLPMVEMALTQILAWGQANIEVSLSLLTARVAAGSRVLGLSVPAHFAPHFVGVGPGPQDNFDKCQARINIPRQASMPTSPSTLWEILILFCQVFARQCQRQRGWSWTEPNSRLVEDLRKKKKNASSGYFPCHPKRSLGQETRLEGRQ